LSQKIKKNKNIFKYSIGGYNEFIKEFENESDRSIIILVVSFIENYLEFYLKKRLINHKFVDSLFEGYASKVDFSNIKIKDLCSNLVIAKGVRTSTNNPYKKDDPKSQFLFSIFWCMIHFETKKERIDPIPILKLKFEIVDDD